MHWELTTPRVLTMEYCEGSKVNDLDYIHRHGINVDDVSDVCCVFGYERKREREFHVLSLNFVSDIVEAWSDVQ